VVTRWPSPADSADACWCETESGVNAQARRTRVERSDFRILSFKNRRFSRSLFLALPNELPLKNQRIGFEPTTQDVVCNRASAHRGTQQPNTPQKLLSKSEARSAVPYGCVLRGSRTHGVTSRDRTCEARARVPTLLHQKHDLTEPPKRRKPPGLDPAAFAKTRKNRLYLPKIHPNEGWQNRARHERTRLPDDAGSASR
jgi:hypothetical protein